ncbi:prohibitin family protein [Elusimicrobiota bacterium]
MEEQDITKVLDSIKKTPFWLIIIGALFFLFLLFRPWVVVGPGERGVVMNFGAVQDAVFNEGLHFRVPVMQDVVLMDVKVQKATTDTVAASADLQDVTSTVALNYHLDPSKTNIVYQKLGIRFKERIIDPAILEIVKAVTAKYTAEELITKRPMVSMGMQEALTERLGKHNITVDAFSIAAFSFSASFTEAIEAKQSAEQLALKASRDLDRIKIEAKQKVTAAKAEAESLRLQRANISGQLIELRKVEANMKAIEKWDGILPQVTGTGSIPMIGLNPSSSQRKRPVQKQ